MSAFEYVTVLIAIVLSLGIAQILTGVASMIKKSHKMIYYWPHLLWTLFILLLHIQEWWIMYELKEQHPWRLPFFLFIMIYPVNLFLLARLLFPDKFSGKVIDMKQFYFATFRKMFLLLSLSAFVSILYNLFVLYMSFTDQILQAMLMVVVALLAGRNIRAEWVHKLVSLTIIATLILSIVIEWNVWLIE